MATRRPTAASGAKDQVARLLTLRKEQPIHGIKTCGAAGARGDGFNQTYLNGDDMARLLLEEMEQDAKEGK